MMNIKTFALIAFLLCLTGCSGLRFVIDTIPAVNRLTETTVLEDKGASSSAKIALIDFTGLISDAKKRGLISPGENPVSRFVESLRKAADDKNTKAIVIRINSPGGTVTASDLLYREILYFKEESKKPVVILMADIAASGGFYMSCAGDEVIAHPTTITGSIGVIMQTFNFSEGMRKIGIKADAITSGPNKAVGSPFEPMPTEHRALLQELVDEFYAEFVAIVKKSKPNLSPADLKWVTDGRVVTGRRAVEIGLVDSVGDLRDAFAAAKRRANLSKAKLIKYHRNTEHVGSAYARKPQADPQVNLLQLNINAGSMFDQTGFYYLWDPTVW
ncbi:MAG: signal peptide peptidase SppA [Planctomycetes bacterium]|nr:signal peptide peptidase SppA [Planctomycetota bacterium]